MSSADGPLFAPGRVIAFAHRGGAGEAPENTWSAFEHAIGLGYRWIETDVHATVDGVAVLCHDADLRRVAGLDIAIPRTTWRKLSREQLADGRPPARLEEAFHAWPDVNWNIDLKHDAAVAAVADVLERCNAHHRVILGSFAGARTAKARSRLGPAVRTSAGRNEIAAFVVAARRIGGGLPGPLRRSPSVSVSVNALWLERLRRAPSSALQVPPVHGRSRLVDRAFVELAHRAGKAVHVWTIDDPQQMAALLDLGVDGIMTDRPTLLREVLTSRGQWT